MSAIEYPRTFMADGSGRPLENGDIYIGEANQDPETFPIQVYWDEALSVPASQPLDVSTGYVMNGGSRADFYIAEDEFSIRLRDKYGNLVDYIASVPNGLLGPEGASNIGTSNGLTVEEMLHWVPRTAIAMNGGDVNFVTSDTYGNTDDGIDGGNWYYGRSLTGTINASPAPSDRGHSGTLFMADARFDDADITGGSTFGIAIYGRMVMTGSGQGGRLGVHGVVDQKVASDAANTNRNYVGASGNVHTYSGDGGTDTGAGALGAYFGGGFVSFAHDGAANLLDFVGVEIDTVAHSTVTARYASALTLGNANRFHGTDVDAALRFSGYTDAYGPGIGWNNLICNTDANSADPTHAGTTLWGTKWITNPATPRAVANGIDWTRHTFSGSVIKAQYLDIQDGLWKSSFTQGTIELTNATRVYQFQPVTTGDFIRILAGGVGDIFRFHASGKHVLPQGLVDAADDTAAASAGIEVNGLYRNGSIVMIRVS